MILVLVAILGFGCGKKAEEGGKVTIVVGWVTDLTGPAGPALVSMQNSLEDLVRYYNEEGLITGAKLKLVTYDARYDPSRDIPGYDWCKERGAKLIMTPLPTTGETLKYFAGRDKTPIASLSFTMPQVEPPGWVFIHSNGYMTEALLNFLSDQWPNYPTKPKIGFASAEEPYSVDIAKKLKGYCQAYPDRFELVGSYLAPVTTMNWSGEIKKLKDCDYVIPPSGGIAAAGFMRDFRAKGYTATFTAFDNITAFFRLITDACGWPALDGTLTAHANALWANQPSPLVDLAWEILHKYRSAGYAEAVSDDPQGYIGGVQIYYFIFDILRKAIEAVGANSFDGQAYYDAALNYKVAMEGFPEWTFSETRRYLIEHVMVYKWSAEKEDLVRVSDWIPAGPIE
jgi:hypothetical protein